MRNYMMHVAQQWDFDRYLLIPLYITVAFVFVVFGSFYLIPRWIDIIPLFLTKTNYTWTCHYFHSNIALNAAINFVGPYTFYHNWDNDRPALAALAEGGQKWTFFWTSHVAVIYAFQCWYVSYNYIFVTYNSHTFRKHTEALFPLWCLSPDDNCDDKIRCTLEKPYWI